MLDRICQKLQEVTDDRFILRSVTWLNGIISRVTISTTQCADGGFRCTFISVLLQATSA